MSDTPNPWTRIPGPEQDPEAVEESPPVFPPPVHSWPVQGSGAQGPGAPVYPGQPYPSPTQGPAGREPAGYAQAPIYPPPMGSPPAQVPFGQPGRPYGQPGSSHYGQVDPSGSIGPAGWSPPAFRTWNGLSIASFVLGIVWLFWIGSAGGLVCGILALRQIGASRGAQRGSALAVIGIVLSSLWLVIGVFAIIGAVAGVKSGS